MFMYNGSAFRYYIRVIDLLYDLIVDIINFIKVTLRVYRKKSNFTLRVYLCPGSAGSD